MLSLRTIRCIRVAAVALLACTLGSCLGPHMINKWVAHHYDPDAVGPAKRKNEQIIITSKMPDAGLLPSTTEKTSHVLPLILFWKLDYRNTCTLNPQIGVNRFSAAVYTYSTSRLKGKINGGRLELTIEQLPHVFLLEDKGWIVLPGFGTETLSIQPTVADLIVSYHLFDKSGAEIKSGSLTIADPDRPTLLRTYHSLKKMTWEYLDRYDEYLTGMSRHLIDQLTSELTDSIAH